MVAGLIVILVMLLWPKKLQSKLPAALAGIIVVLLVDVFVDFDIVTVGTIPKTLLHEQRLTLASLDFQKLEKLFVPAISIAALGMIQTLLCGAAAGKLKGKKLNADHELLAQGIGNVFIPFFGGVPATAAIARTIVGIKNGGQTRITSIVHSVTLIACIFLLGPVISRIPLAGLAGVLMVTAWKMNDWDGIKEFFRRRYKTSISQFLATMVATVVFDLTTAIIIGVALSMVLFVMRSSYLEISVDNIDKNHVKGKNLTENASGIKLVYVSGQIFFGSQDRIINCIHSLSDAKSIVLSIRGVPSIDQSAMGELRGLWEEYKARGVDILFCGLQPQVEKMFERSGFLKVLGEKNVYQHAVEAIQEALARHGTPEIVNTDQGSQFTAQDFVDAVQNSGAQLSMDGRGAWRDNVFVERVWRSVKYERVYLRAYASVREARADIGQYIDWYNRERPHSSQDGNTPEQAYLAGLPTLPEAA